MRLRRAIMDDALDVLAWRNDPLAVAMSKTPGVIDERAHMAWFARAIRDEDRVMLVALKADKKVGMVRFDRTGEAWLVSINIAPEQREGLFRGRTSPSDSFVPGYPWKP